MLLFFTEENGSCAGSDHRFTSPTGLIHIGKSIRINGGKGKNTLILLSYTPRPLRPQCISSLMNECLNQKVLYLHHQAAMCLKVNYSLKKRIVLF